MNRVYDVAVVGAGPIGLAFLGALSQANFHAAGTKPFLLIDQVKTLPQRLIDPTPNQRVLAVSKHTEDLLRSIGAWDNLQLDRVHRYDRMDVWESHGSGTLAFEDASLGHIIEYDNLVQALAKCVADRGMTEMALGLSVTDLVSAPDQYLHAKTKDLNLETKLLVGSDGNKSKVKELSHIGTYGWSYNQMGIVCTVQSTTQSSTAYQRFLNNGLPLALLPLWDGMYSIVWSVSSDDFQYLNTLSDTDFIEEINHSLHRGTTGLLPPLITGLCNKRLSFPLQTLQSKRYVGNRVALIGDAAHSIHPLAGQGMNVGMNDAVFLANTVIKNLRAGCDIGCPQALDEYESQAKLMNYATSIGMEGIKKLYESTNSDLINMIRNAGASILQSTPQLKSLLQRQASHHVLGPNKFEW